MPIDPRFFTDAVHAGVQADPATGAIMTPIYQTSTYVQSEPGVHKGWDYSRAGNPTRDALEAAFADLEKADHGLAFASGLAAEQAIVQAVLQPGDQVLVSDDVYGGTGRLFRRLFSKYNIEFVFLDFCEIANIKAALTPKTKMIWLETPSNPMMKVVSIRQVADLAKSVSAVLVVDNTFASPVFQTPLDHGADLVLHSTTKYIGGHSDIIGGAVMTSRKDLHESIRFVQFAGGAVPGPLESFLLLRSLKTLAVRMRQHEDNAWEVARFLQNHPDVKKLYFPGLSKDTSVVQEQMRGQSGMMSFELHGDYQRVVQFLQSLKVFSLAESLGGVESLVNHPEKMTHASVPEELRQKLGITSQLIRLSVGIEAAKDLTTDLKQAFQASQKR